jgi:hypothetical protein
LNWNAYFRPQWTTVYFVWWQIWNTPPGGSSGNNLIESVNKKLKACFTKYQSLSVLNLLHCLGEYFIVYNSFHLEPISLAPIIPTEKDDPCVILDVNWSKAWTKDNFKFTVGTGMPNIIQFTGINASNTRYYYFIDMAQRSCSCSNYIDRVICHHLMFASKLYKSLQLASSRFHQLSFSSSSQLGVEKGPVNGTKKTRLIFQTSNFLL